jgi:hypothetical protein
MAKKQIAAGALLVAAALAGCAHDPIGITDPIGWKHVSTAHFDLYTRQGRHAYGPILERLEMVHAALSKFFFGMTDVPGFDVFLYEPEDALYILGDYGGQFTHLDGRGTLVMKDGASSETIDPLAAHELSHGFIGATFRTIPVWFNEGFATYLGSIRMRSDMACFGGRDRMQSREAYRGQLVPVRELFSVGGSGFHDPSWETSHYVSGWAVIHYLFHGEGNRLRRRFDAFAKHFAVPDDVHTVSFEAWADTYPEIPIEQLDNRIKDHLRDVYDRPGGKCMGFPFEQPPTPNYKVVPADMAFINKREAYFKAHPMRLRW